tara:strand:- start:2292 stop:2468 length:177 start_codon:yes stop_codon:yes gene_type:complete
MAYPIDPIYKLFKNLDGEINCILTERDGLLITIPLDNLNRDYQEYLEWAKTNTAEAAD